MKIIFITAKPSYMPDPEELGTWQPMQVDEGFYMQTLGDYHLFVHECLSDLSSDTNNVKLKVEKKHALVASWLKTILSYAQQQWGEISKKDVYVILHDRDLIAHDARNEEGIYGEERILSVNSGLEGMLDDGHVYLFMHSIAQDMCQALINDLIEPSIDNVESALQVIKRCTNEA